MNYTERLVERCSFNFGLDREGDRAGVLMKLDLGSAIDFANRVKEINGNPRTRIS